MYICALLERSETKTKITFFCVADSSSFNHCHVKIGLLFISSIHKSTEDDGPVAVSFVQKDDFVDYWRVRHSQG